MTEGNMEQGKAADSGKKRVLVIEDDVEMAEMIKLRIEASRSDCDVMLSHDGEDGLKCIYANHVDLLILDINLPKKSGIEVFNKIDADGKRKEFPILILTARKELEQFFESLNVESFISKPFDARDLMGEIDRTILRKDKPAVFIMDNEAKTLSFGMKVLLINMGYKVVFVKDMIAFKKAAAIDRPVFALIECDQQDINVGDMIKAMKEFTEEMKKLKKGTGIPSVLAHRVWPENHRLRIIAFSSTDKEYGKICQDAGASEYISQPKDSEAVVSTLREIQIKMLAKGEFDNMGFMLRRKTTD